MSNTANTAKTAKKFEQALRILGELTLKTLIRIGLNPVITGTNPKDKNGILGDYVLIKNKPATKKSFYSAALAGLSMERKILATLPKRKLSPRQLVLGIVLWPFMISIGLSLLGLMVTALAITSAAAAFTLGTTGTIDGIKALDKKVKASMKAKKSKSALKLLPVFINNPVAAAPVPMPTDNPLFDADADFATPAPAPTAKKGSTFNVKKALSKLLPECIKSSYQKSESKRDAKETQQARAQRAALERLDSPPVQPVVDVAEDERSEARMSFNS